MKTSRKSRVPMSEQVKLINECRKSGMTDAEWCREHNISPRRRGQTVVRTDSASHRPYD